MNGDLQKKQEEVNAVALKMLRGLVTLIESGEALVEGGEETKDTVDGKDTGVFTTTLTYYVPSKDQIKAEA